MDEQTVFETVKRIVLTVVPEINPEDVVMTASLADLGCNSLDRADVLMMTMQELAIAVPVDEFRQGDRIGKVVALLQRHA